MRRRGRVVAVLAALLGAGSLAWSIPAVAGGSASVVPAAGGAGARVHLELAYTPPVLVRAGERVSLPVDGACLTAAAGVCSATVTVATRAGGAGWSRASAPASALLRFDLTAAVTGALGSDAASGSVAFTISERARAGGADSLGTASVPPASM